MQTRTRSSPLSEAELETSDLLGRREQEVLVESRGGRNEWTGVGTCLGFIGHRILVCEFQDSIVWDGCQTSLQVSKKTIEWENGAHVNSVVERPLTAVLPIRIPLAVMNLKGRAVIDAVLPSAASHVLPAPSFPAGQRMFMMLLKFVSEEAG